MGVLMCIYSAESVFCDSLQHNSRSVLWKAKEFNNQDNFITWYVNVVEMNVIVMHIYLHNILWIVIYCVTLLLLAYLEWHTTVTTVFAVRTSWDLLEFSEKCFITQDTHSALHKQTLLERLTEMSHPNKEHCLLWYLDRRSQYCSFDFYLGHFIFIHVQHLDDRIELSCIISCCFCS